MNMKRKLTAMALTAVMTLSMGSTVFAAGWQKNDTGWWWQMEDGTYPTESWQWLDGNKDGIAECYYFDRLGYMLENTAAPDGYIVNAEGMWTIDGVVQTKSMPVPQEAELPHWYFLFAVFKNVDADCRDEHNVMQHAKYSMTQDEVDIIRNHAVEFEEYMNQVGVMHAHVEVVEIDAVVTELQERDGADGVYGSYVEQKQASFLLNGRVDLNRYDHVTCIASLNVRTGFLGVGGMSFENGTGHSFINFVNRDTIKWYTYPNSPWSESIYVHEFLHFMEGMNRKWGLEFSEHFIGEKFYKPNTDAWKACYTDIILNRVKGDVETGTGVFPAAWQYPPHVLRTMHELTIPSGVTSIGNWAFQDCSALTKVSIPDSVVSIGAEAFQRCTALEELEIPSSFISIGVRAFQDCSQLAKVDIPSGVAAIGEGAFERCTTLREVVIPSGVSSIGTWAFKDCSQLTKVDIISSGESTIGGCAFQGCTSLTEVVIPSGVTSIGNWAFQGCSALTRVSIPDSVASIEEVAFYETNPKHVYYDGTEEQWKAIQIGDYNSSLTQAVIHYNDAGWEMEDGKHYYFETIPTKLYPLSRTNFLTP